MDDFPTQRLRLLIVENDRVTARDLESTLRRRGFVVVGVAHTAAQALDSIDRERPDLVLLDIHLGEPGDGIVLAAHLRENHGIPFIFVTGYSEEAILERARAIEPAAFLRKPFSDAEITVCLKSVVESRSSVEHLDSRIPGLRAVAEKLPQAVFATRLDGTLVYLNPAAEELSGWAAAEALGETLAAVAPLRENAGAGEGTGSEPAAIEGGGRRARLAQRSGESLSIEEQSEPIRDADGEAIGLVTVMAATSSEPPAASAARSDDSDNSDEGDTEMATASDSEEAFTPPPPPVARTEALRRIASLASDPAFKNLIARKKIPPAASSAPPPPSGPGPSLTRAAIEALAPVTRAPDPPAASDVPQGPTQGSPQGPAPAEATAASEGVVSDPPPLATATSGGADPDGFAEVGDPLLRLDEEGAIRYANAEAVRVFAHGGRFVGTLFRDHFDPEDLSRYEPHFSRPLRDGRRHRFDFHDSRRGLWFEVRAYPTREGILALFTDITATRLEAVEQVRQHRLEGLGLLARGFAHDFNNSLTTLTGNISLARERHPDDAVLQAMLEEAQGAASKATGLVQQLMTFARGGRPIRERTRIPDLIRRILTEQRLRHPEIRFQYQGGDPGVVAKVDPAQIGRLVENLVVNSVAAMPDGGVLVVRSSRLSPEEVLKVRASHTPSEEDHLLVEVIDTGHGMSEGDLERVFEPYFTTRRENNATGIGLTVCESIAKAHGGFIQLQSKEGKGTIATFCAPLGRHRDESGLAEGEPAYPNFDIPQLRPAASPAGAGEPLLVGTRILILEDDAPIRRLMAATLRRAGHEVVETKEGRETIALYSDALQRGEPFHLLICDLTIENGMGGVETMRRLLQIDPGILAIVSSGYSDAPAMSSPASFGFKGVLPKPYAPTELRAAVHRILAAHRIIP